MSNHGWLISILSHPLHAHCCFVQFATALPARTQLWNPAQGMSPLHLQVPHVVVSSGASLDPASTGAATLPAPVRPDFRYAAERLDQ